MDHNLYNIYYEELEHGHPGYYFKDFFFDNKFEASKKDSINVSVSVSVATAVSTFLKHILIPFRSVFSHMKASTKENDWKIVIYRLSWENEKHELGSKIYCIEVKVLFKIL